MNKRAINFTQARNSKETAMKACFVCNLGGRLDFVFDESRKAALRARLSMLEPVVNRENIGQLKEALKEVEVIVATWDMTPFTGEELDTYFPNLKLVLYAAGSVRYFAEPFLQRGIKVLSAWGAMAVPVAEYTVSAILHANKGFYLAMARYRDLDYRAGKHIATELCPGTYNTAVGVLGAGMIGSLVIGMLKRHSVILKVYDPFMSEEKARQLGVTQTSLEDIFETCQTITNHVANNPQTVGMLGYDLFRRMGQSATFINTGRGAQVVESDLVRALREQPNRCALLDVTWPEPCPKDHPFWTLPNLFMTPHIAGYAAHEVYCLSDCMIEELDRYLKGEPNKYEVTLPMLKTMA
jgi:phosphoglycerate dehydrogenase-like enzyme